MKHLFAIFCLCGLLFVPILGAAQQIDVNAVDYPTGSQQGQIRFSLSQAAKHRQFILDKPLRLVIDLSNTRLSQPLKQPASNHPVFAKIRAGNKNATDLRVIVDLKTAAAIKDLSVAAESQNQQLLIHLANKSAVTTALVKNQNKIPKNPSPQPSAAKRKLITVAIDAGHGGNDPGAKGNNGTQEKDVTFAIAKKLAAQINAQTGMKAVLIRNADYYVDLRNRMNIARAAKADLFVSIHADAFKDVAVRGASVYTLSRGGASDEAAHWLAEKENSADLLGGVSLNDKEDDVAHVLLDLSQNATHEASFQVANEVLKSFAEVSALHKDHVQKAEFAVLKSPDIPSILVETAFISNPLEEENLINERYQSKMSDAIFKGIYNYFKYTAPADNRMAEL